ncbi:heavy-metal-associated domain-containing protein [Pedobacter sp. LMG 31464]|uniref:Heavy-metal-associated domain-containing protein n=1 Tax=Pedobacter planticolens TaxID=2679964 RepID=A0A923E280_9SPHI|nr:heavy metal-associated domain-containing protein [Pedobacter planticolens]MBB2146214.1 heavy-metal-associated domain-containing protein [Pedobacter planticolens]
MKHTYQVTGMTCSGCENKVKSSLLLVPDIMDVEVSKDTNSATITMEKHVGLSTLQDALGGNDSKYQISAQAHSEILEETKSFWETYKPVLLLFGYVGIISLIASWQNETINGELFMRFFMAGFFLSFSFFKLINLKGFAESYAMYDIVGKIFKPWGYIYAFIELGLGLAFALNFNPVVTNLVTLIVMTISIIGVLQSVLNKRKIQCACLGAVFNLPMSTLTIIEDFLMIAMSATMLIIL